ncbi:MAG: pantetheine-phosphate adenylyltransferase [Eubacterium sp.]|nr:pantetheine-phosphate adenylyltransferase [Eubacterium sp.]
MAVTAVYPGSFDPVTVGHMDLIRRAAGLFDRLVVAVLVNSEKKSPLFSFDERVIMLQDACKNIPNVSVERFEGLLVDFVRSKKDAVIIRGLRELMDFDMELQMAQVNRIASGVSGEGIETLFLPTDPKYSHISSSVVREYARYHVPLKEFVPENVLEAMKEKGIVK